MTTVKVKPLLPLFDLFNESHVFIFSHEQWDIGLFLATAIHVINFLKDLVVQSMEGWDFLFYKHFYSKINIHALCRQLHPVSGNSLMA